MSFEEVALKFIETKNDVALRVYLEKKLKSYKPAEVIRVFMPIFASIYSKFVV